MSIYIEIYSQSIVKDQHRKLMKMEHKIFRVKYIHEVLNKGMILVFHLFSFKWSRCNLKFVSKLSSEIIKSQSYRSVMVEILMSNEMQWPSLAPHNEDVPYVKCCAARLMIGILATTTISSVDVFFVFKNLAHKISRCD